MGPVPITYGEIEAYSRLTHARMSVWDIRTLRRIDAAVLAVWASEQPKPGNRSGGSEVPVTDATGVKNLLLSKSTLAN